MEILRGRKQKKEKAIGNKTTRNKAKEDKKIWKEKEKRNMSSEREIQGNCREHQKFPTCGTLSVVRRKQLYPAETQICQRTWGSLARNRAQLPNSKENG